MLVNKDQKEKYFFLKESDLNYLSKNQKRLLYEMLEAIVLGRKEKEITNFYDW